MRRGALIFAAVLILAGSIWFFGRPRTPELVLAPPTTAPTTAATQPIAPPPSRPKQYMDVVLKRYPNFPTTQPLVIPVADREAARLILEDPIYLDAIGELWVTRDDAESIANVFKTVAGQSTHVLRENVVFVHRWPDERGVWQPQLVCRKAEGGFEIVTRTGRKNISGEHAYQWHRAFSWNDVVVVPTDRGISVIRPDRLPMELHHDFVAEADYSPDKFNPVQALLDWRGLITWMPWENGKSGSNGAARFLGDAWTALDSSANWPAKIVHLIPLLDGSAIQLVLADDNAAEIKIASLDTKQVDEQAVTNLVRQLSAENSTDREAAFDELSRFGPGAWGILEKLRATQPPGAAGRIGQLLLGQQSAMLGSMQMDRGPLKTLARGPFGAVMFHAEQGVRVKRSTEEDGVPIAPAWIDIQPGRAISLAPAALVEELKGANRELRLARGESFVHDPVNGLRWFISNHFSSPLLKESERAFGHLIGQDGRGRWLFRKNAEDYAPTLLVDPTLPDPTPRLPVWVYASGGAQTGWSGADWPAIKLGGAWELRETEWIALDETKDKFLPAADAFPKSDPPKSDPPKSDPPKSDLPKSDLPNADTPTSASSAILVESDGTQFFDGRENLVMVRKDGSRVSWPLPPEATGSIPPTLLRAGANNRLYLFNSAGRLLRIAQTPTDPVPFEIEATFTHNIPSSGSVHRVWRDPGGRIIFAHNDDTLVICFPDGRIPADLVTKMTAKDLADAEPDDEAKK